MLQGIDWWLHIRLGGYIKTIILYRLGLDYTTYCIGKYHSIYQQNAKVTNSIILVD